eukprot:15480072-Alexandrium_andersonii.AAC.1
MLGRQQVQRRCARLEVEPQAAMPSGATRGSVAATRPAGSQRRDDARHRGEQPEGDEGSPRCSSRDITAHPQGRTHA